MSLLSLCLCLPPAPLRESVWPATAFDVSEVGGAHRPSEFLIVSAEDGKLVKSNTRAAPRVLAGHSWCSEGCRTGVLAQADGAIAACRVAPSRSAASGAIARRRPPSMRICVAWSWLASCRRIGCFLSKLARPSSSMTKLLFWLVVSLLSLSPALLASRLRSDSAVSHTGPFHQSVVSLLGRSISGAQARLMKSIRS